MIVNQYMTSVSAFLFSLGLAWLPAPALADNFDNLVGLCEGCHGQHGNSIVTMFPSISGYSFDGFVTSMNGFRDDERILAEFQQPGTPESAMTKIAQKLSTEEVEALAEYFTARQFIPRRQSYDPKLVPLGAALHEEHCERCHSGKGADPDADVPILAGQWTPYLRSQFDNLLHGKRLVSRRMSIRVKKLTQNEIDALLSFYASVR
jgi:sulfide dehydrogenase cytochrome subunit